MNQYSVKCKAPGFPEREISAILQNSIPAIQSAVPAIVIPAILQNRIAGCRIELQIAGYVADCKKKLQIKL